MARYLAQEPGWKDDCLELASSVKINGCAYVHDPRTDYSINPDVIRQFQRYYALKSEQVSRGEIGDEMGMDEDRNIPIGFQKSNQAKFVEYASVKKGLKSEDRSHTPVDVPITDPTLRVRWLLDSPYNRTPP